VNQSASVVLLVLLLASMLGLSLPQRDLSTAIKGTSVFDEEISKIRSVNLLIGSHEQELSGLLYGNSSDTLEELLVKAGILDEVVGELMEISGYGGALVDAWGTEYRLRHKGGYGLEAYSCGEDRRSRSDGMDPDDICVSNQSEFYFRADPNVFRTHDWPETKSWLVVVLLLATAMTLTLMLTSRPRTAK